MARARAVSAPVSEARGQYLRCAGFSIDDGRPGGDGTGFDVGQPAARAAAAHQYQSVDRIWPVYLADYARRRAERLGGAPVHWRGSLAVPGLFGAYRDHPIIDLPDLHPGADLPRCSAHRGHLPGDRLFGLLFKRDLSAAGNILFMLLCGWTLAWMFSWLFPYSNFNWALDLCGYRPVRRSDRLGYAADQAAGAADRQPPGKAGRAGGDRGAQALPGLYQSFPAHPARFAALIYLGRSSEGRLTISRRRGQVSETCPTYVGVTIVDRSHQFQVWLCCAFGEVKNE